MLIGLEAKGQTYATPPYFTSFETGAVDASWLTMSSLSTGECTVKTTETSSWGTTQAHDGVYFLGMHHPAAGGGAYNTNEAWLHLDLSSSSGYTFDFWWAEFGDESEVQDGVFLSDDGGVTFVKAVDLPGASYTDLQYYYFTYNLDSMIAANGLSMNSTFVIKFQQYDNYYFHGGNDGFLIDEVGVSGPACSPTANSFTTSGCDFYTVPSGDETYSTSGTYNDTIPNMAGCDSVLTITVNMNNSSASSITDTACGDETYTSSGVYADTIANAMGCDSIMSIDVTINNVDASATQTGGINLSATTAGATYQWVDCDNAYAPIAGATSQNYTATANGNYAVIVTDNGCTDTSACLSVTNVGIEDLDVNDFAIFPNPNNGEFTLTINTNNAVNIEIYNVVGEVIYQDRVNTNQVEINLGDVEAGVYLIKIFNDNSVIEKSIVIE